MQKIKRWQSARKWHHGLTCLGNSLLNVCNFAPFLTYVSFDICIWQNCYGFLHAYKYSSCSTWHIQSIWMGLVHQPSSQTQVLRNFKSRFGLFLHLLVLNRSDWFWMICLDKSAPLVLVFLKVQFLVLHFFNYTLMIFLIMCSVILLFPLRYQIIVKSRLSILRQNSPVRCLFDKV